MSEVLNKKRKLTVGMMRSCGIPACMDREMLKEIKDTRSSNRLRQNVKIQDATPNPRPGALQGQRVKKGIFIITSNFTKDANDYAAMIDSRIALIDGIRLCIYD